MSWGAMPSCAAYLHISTPQHYEFKAPGHRPFEVDTLVRELFPMPEIKFGPLSTGRATTISRYTTPAYDSEIQRLLKHYEQKTPSN